MGLTFGAVTSDRVSCGVGATLNDLTALTALGWFYPTTLTGGRALISKFNGAVAGWAFYVNNAGGDLKLEWIRATTNIAYITNDTPLSALNTWHFIAVTATQTGPEVHIYHGTQTAAPVESTYLTTTAGSGTYPSDSAQNLFIGNRDNATINQAFRGRIGPLLLFNRVLPPGEITQLWAHRFKADGCVDWIECGWDGTGTQRDLSGNGNNGTVTGATLIDHPPLGPLFWEGVPDTSIAAAPNFNADLAMMSSRQLTMWP